VCFYFSFDFPGNRLRRSSLLAAVELGGESLLLSSLLSLLLSSLLEAALSSTAIS